MCALRVGVVGAAGQVGLALLSALGKTPDIFAVGICRSEVSSARVASHGLEVRIVQTDVPARLEEATADLDALVNCALPQYRPSKTSLANQRLARALAQVCAGKHLVHLSSVAVYGEFIANSPKRFRAPRPDSNYGRQKLQMEMLVRREARRFGARSTILRVGHVYGPELRWSEAICSLARDPGFRLPFGGDRPSNAIAIFNLAQAARSVLLLPSADATFNLTDAPQTTWRELFDLHAQACGYPPVLPLSCPESDAEATILRRWARMGIFSRLLIESARWMKRLPGSYLGAVPSLKAVAQMAVAAAGSEALDARIWALNCRHIVPRGEIAPSNAIDPLFFSDAVPGTCLEYPTANRQILAESMHAWYNAIAEPQPLIWA